MHSTTRWLWMIPALLLTFALGARMLNYDAIWLDEYFAIYDAGGDSYGPLSPGDLWTRVAEQDPFLPPLYFFLLSGWGWTAGWSALSIRALSLLIGVLAVAWTYRLGRDLFSSQVGLFAAAMLGTSAFFVDYLHEARNYTLYVLVTSFTVWAYWRLVTAKRSPSLVQYGALTLGVAGLAYTHYAALVVAAALGVYHVLFALKNRRWLYITLALAAGGLLFLPWLSVILHALDYGAQDINRRITSMPNGTAVQTLLYAFSNGSIALLALVGVYALKARGRAAALLWTWLLVGLGLILLVNAVQPFLIHIRYALALWPALALVAAVGAAMIGRSGLNPRVLAAVWCAVGVWQTFQPSFVLNMFGSVYRTPWAGLSQAFDILKRDGQPGDLAILHVTQIGFEELNAFALRYLMRDLPVRFDQFERMNNSLHYDDAGYLPDVRAAIDGAPFIWTLVVPELPTTNRSAVVQHVLRDEYAVCEIVLDRPDMRMEFLARRPESEPLAVFGANGEIGLYVLKPIAHDADDTLDVLLGWTVDGSIPPETYSVGLHVDNAAGELAAQGSDYGLPGAPFGCRASHVDTSRLPPGEYTLKVVVYHWRTGARLPGRMDDVVGDRLAITQVTIR